MSIDRKTRSKPLRKKALDVGLEKQITLTCRILQTSLMSGPRPGSTWGSLTDDLMAGVLVGRNLVA